MRSRKTFTSIAAQPDNLGDIEIRRTLLNWVIGDGGELVVFTGAMPQEYVEAFELPDSVELVSSSAQFERRLIGAALTRRANIAFAPGPQVLAPSLRATAKSFANLLNIAAVRVTGGGAIAVGRSFRGSGKLTALVERANVRMLNIYVARDEVSAGVLGRPLRHAPDLAFASTNDTQPSASGTHVVLSFRSDRPIDLPGLKRLVERLSTEGLRPIVVTQVRRDDSQHAKLASELGIEFLSWTTQSYSEQFEAVNRIYSESVAVISNRLHALILGIQANALPVGLVDRGSDKLRSTLGPWTNAQFFDMEELNPDLMMEFIANSKSNRSILALQVVEARAVLSRLEDDVCGVLR